MDTSTTNVPTFAIKNMTVNILARKDVLFAKKMKTKGVIRKSTIQMTDANIL